MRLDHRAYGRRRLRRLAAVKRPRADAYGRCAQLVTAAA
ncbi:hypothetical protein SGL43_07393 [Streptomyces globisporus]|uniref:Uncharacterized protein n=1 Tax=Streptomyces globisporus TaxID=1908 RepID=A0ABM9H9H4_STRGL|nr:hypothetical protein SGL43_07393 [Streptomyces globisporus]